MPWAGGARRTLRRPIGLREAAGVGEAAAVPAPINDRERTRDRCIIYSRESGKFSTLICRLFGADDAAMTVELWPGLAPSSQSRKAP